MISKNRIETLIFDYDGVIADTEPLYWRTWAASLEPLGIDLTWNQYCEIGRGVHETRMLESLVQFALDPAMRSELEKQNAVRKSILRDLCINEPPIHRTTIEMLHSFESYRLGLVTSSEKSEVLPVLRAAGIDQCFDAMVFGDEVEHRKPAPDPYLLLSKRMGSWTGIVFEDSDAGILSARQAGYTAIRVPDAEQLSQIVYRELSRR